MSNEKSSQSVSINPRVAIAATEQLSSKCLSKHQGGVDPNSKANTSFWAKSNIHQL
jgi:hypothetical protein